MTGDGKLTKSDLDVLWKGLIRLILLVVIMLATLLLSAGRWDWWEAWAYTITGLLVLLGSRAFMIKKHPDLALERAQAHEKEDVKGWDRFLMPFTALIGPFISWIVAGLDQRFGWSPDLPDWIQIVALAVIQVGSLIGSWAMIANRYFSSQVRIQADRGQTVVRDGPYRYVRHPGYAGGLLSWLAGPVFFSSLWVILPTVLVIIASLVRTALEDRTLREELPGYEEYASETKYRVLPGIW
jgi:protein-S-isoprenylcysteine O-methyltransferase Ste14